MDIFSKEVEICSIYAENAEMNALTNFFMESDDVTEDTTSPSKLQKIRDRLKDTIDKIIQAFKDFIRNIKNRFEAAKLNKMLADARRDQMRMLSAEIHDRELVKACQDILKVNEKAIMMLNKAHVDFINRKIDYDEFMKRSDDIQEKGFDAIEKLSEKYENSKLVEVNYDTRKGAIKVAAAAERVGKVSQVQMKVLTKIENDVDAMADQIKKESKEARTAQEAQAASKTTQSVTKISRISTSTIIKILGVVAAASALVGGGVYAAKKKKASATMESSEFSLEDLIGDLMTESADDSYDDDPFAEFVDW